MTPKTSFELRPELTPLPERIERLPVHRGYPVPWFAVWKDGEPDFRVADGIKWAMAVKGERCWVCGQKLGANLAFVLGPMCGITRSTVEPACHRSCAEWSIQNCPFLTRPHMTRREGGLAEEAEMRGMPITRNPGVTLLWITHGFEVFQDQNGHGMIRVGEPQEVVFYAEGKIATRAQIDVSIAGGLPSLEDIARQEGAQAMAALSEQTKEFEKLLPQ